MRRACPVFAFGQLFDDKPNGRRHAQDRSGRIVATLGSDVSGSELQRLAGTVEEKATKVREKQRRRAGLGEEKECFVFASNRETLYGVILVRLLGLAASFAANWANLRASKPIARFSFQLFHLNLRLLVSLVVAQTSPTPLSIGHFQPVPLVCHSFPSLAFHHHHRGRRRRHHNQTRNRLTCRDTIVVALHKSSAPNVARRTNGANNQRWWCLSALLLEVSRSTQTDGDGGGRQMIVRKKHALSTGLSPRACLWPHFLGLHRGDSPANCKHRHAEPAKSAQSFCARQNKSAASCFCVKLKTSIIKSNRQPAASSQ